MISPTLSYKTETTPSIKAVLLSPHPLQPYIGHLLLERALKGFPTKKKLLPVSNFFGGGSSPQKSPFFLPGKRVSPTEILLEAEGKAENLWVCFQTGETELVNFH